MHVLKTRSNIITGRTSNVLSVENLLRTALAGSSSSSSSSSSSCAPDGASSAGMTVVPREQQLLLPLVLTVIELALLLPAPEEGVLHTALQMIVHIMRTAQFAPAAAHNEAAAAAPAPAAARANPPHTEAAVNEALAGAVFRQLGPAVMQYLREEPAAPGSSAASFQAVWQGRNARDVASVEVVRGAFSTMAEVIISTGERVLQVAWFTRSLDPARGGVRQGGTLRLHLDDCV
jgi:hypothetical protein